MTLDVQNLHVAYDQSTVIEGADIVLHPGEVTALIGPNGVGKSTLLKAVAGLIPAGGSLSLNGQPLDARERHDCIAYMPQDIGPTSSLSLLEVVLLGRLRSLGLSVPESLCDEAQKALARFGLGNLQGRTLDAISGGQRQLVYLAQALFRKPDILLLDEPTAALDLRHQLIVLEAVRSLARSNGTTIVVAMHDLTMASQFCDRMICLHRGQIDADGTPATVLTRDRLRRVYHVDAAISASDHGGLTVTPLRPVSAPDG